MPRLRASSAKRNICSAVLPASGMDRSIALSTIDGTRAMSPSENEIVVTPNVPPITINTAGRSKNASADPPTTMAAMTSPNPATKPSNVAWSRRDLIGEIMLRCDAPMARLAFALAMIGSLVAVGLDDFGHRYAKALLYDDDLAPRDKSIIDVYVDRFADLPVEFHDSAAA